VTSERRVAVDGLAGFAVEPELETAPVGSVACGAEAEEDGACDTSAVDGGTELDVPV
jgi:hypothetical protein